MGIYFKSTKKHDSIEAAALNLLESTTYTDITVDDICKKAHCARNTFYSHFRSKNQLYLSVVDSQMHDTEIWLTRVLKDLSGANFITFKYRFEHRVPYYLKNNIRLLLETRNQPLGFSARLVSWIQHNYLESMGILGTESFFARLYATSFVLLLNVSLNSRLSVGDLTAFGRILGTILDELQLSGSRRSLRMFNDDDSPAAEVGNLNYPFDFGAINDVLRYDDVW